MYDEDITYHNLGVRAIYAGWDWQPGALALHGYRILSVHNKCAWVAIETGCIIGVDGSRFAEHASNAYRSTDNLGYPDFRDPATLGILQHRVLNLVPGAVSISVKPWPTGYDREWSITWLDKWGRAPVTLFGPLFDVPKIQRKVRPDWFAHALIACLQSTRDGASYAFVFGETLSNDKDWIAKVKTLSTENTG